MTDQFHRFVGPYNLLTDSFTNIHLQMGTIYSKSSLQSVSLFQNPIFRKDNWTNSERSKARRQQQIECDSGLVSPRVKNIQVENEGHLVSNNTDQSPSWIESSAKFTRNRSIAIYEENLNFKSPIKRAKSRPGASSNVTEHTEDELYHPNSIHSPAARSKTPVRKPKSVLCSSLTNDFYSRSQDRMSPSPVRCGSKNSETSSVSEAMPVEIQNSQFGTQSQNRGISHYSAQFDQRCDFEGSRTGQNFEVTNSNFSAASGLEMSFNISAQGYLQTNACGLVKPTFPTIGPMSMASYHSLSSNPFLSHNLRMVQYHPNLQYIAATALVGEGQRQNWQQTPNAPVCHNDEDSRQMLLTNQEVISYDTAKRMYEGAINIVTGPTLTEETVDNNTRSTRSTSKITMPRKENTTKSSKKTNDSLSRNDKNMPTKKSKQKNRAAHQARPANPRRKTCKDPEEMELESKFITHVSKARSKRFSHGSEVYVVDEENKVFVIDLVNSETCDLICQLADEHCQRAEVSGNTSSSWRTLYTYSKMDLPCGEVGVVKDIVDDIMKKIIRIVGDLYCNPKGASGLRPRSWKEPHLLKYQKVEGKMPHLGICEHYDGCDVTWQLMLTDINDYGGGGTYFRSLKKTVKLRKGQALIHPGELYHKGLDITFGIRELVVCFLDGFDPQIIDGSDPSQSLPEHELNIVMFPDAPEND